MSAKHASVDLSKIGKSHSPMTGGGIGCTDPNPAAIKTGEKAITRVMPRGRGEHRNRHRPGDGKNGAAG